MNARAVSPRDIAIRFGDDGSRSAEEAQARAPLLAKAFGLGDQETLSVMYTQGADGQVRHIRYARACAGVRVNRGDVFIDVGIDGRITEATTYVAPPIKLPTAIPTLSADDAERIVRGLVAAAELPTFKPERWNLPWTFRGAYLEVFAPGRPARLVWHTLLDGTISTSGARVVLDAHTGEVLWSWTTGCFSGSGPCGEQVSLLQPV